MPISSDRKKQFRQIGHNLKPIVMVAEKGLSEGLLGEIERALEDHELIKVKIAINDRESRKLAIAELCKLARAEVVQEIGKVALIFRAAREPNPKLSNIMR
ncbi:ribosome assembly RNA-binding protein YhbY [Simiduia curdlanivorans]|uniref:Ribosome assembly RNA-binding protein YhbY n=1 Tax=Simiduia curdlanivorans TaxID=1492769 RepID=A0ABV8V4C7_9GAMM|nr:ribosome assembly RNA-binding protein YhbY [Simiduia curdlanivorans]MDN3640900.1 ribosome assembly RNA-binding protein YhbY [Simiduia curdlanivorans]